MLGPKTISQAMVGLECIEEHTPVSSILRYASDFPSGENHMTLLVPKISSS